MITVKNIQVIEKLTYPNNEPGEQMPFFSATCYSEELAIIEATASTERKALRRLKKYVHSIKGYNGLKSHRWPL